MLFRALIWDSCGGTDMAYIEAPDKEKGYEIADEMSGNMETWFLFDKDEWDGIKKLINNDNPTEEQINRYNDTNDTNDTDDND